MKQNINYIDLEPHSEGNIRRLELMHDVLDGGTFLPKTVLYKDIDEAFQGWVKSLRIVSDEGREYPTMSLFSNQRFSEYSQSWQYTDENNNLILNFKTITRENNPQYGKIHGGLWNIPGDRFYLMKRQKVLDDNGTESFLDLKMKVPVAVDFNYSVSIFTTKFQSINDFNTIMNTEFASRQAYIAPNGHYMPMKLESISDKSEYQISDRQFYSQTYNVVVMGYIIQEDDYRVEEVPLKHGLNMGVFKMPKSKRANVELVEGRVEDYVGLSLAEGESMDECTLAEAEKRNPYYYKPVTLDINFPTCTNISKFTMDTDMVVLNVYILNVLRNHYQIFINDEKTEQGSKIHFKNGDKLTVKIDRRRIEEPARVVIYGYDTNVVYDKRMDDNPLIDEDIQPTLTEEITANGSQE